MTQAAPTKTHDTQALDTLTGGAFTAPTSGERAARVRDWLASNPGTEQMQEVFRELSGRDKGAARLLRERLDEIKRSKGQEAIAAEWAEKANALLSPAKLNIADALAWQRDAAKAGAPLSREPLASLKSGLADRVKGIEDLQHRVQVQREAAVLLAQRIEVLSTKSWRDAQASATALQADIPDWEVHAQALLSDPNWASVDTRFPPLLEASRSQLHAVWDAFRSAVSLAEAAAGDPAAPLPPVPVWADELRQGRGLPPEAAPKPAARPRIDPELRAKATAVIQESLTRLEQEIAQGHGKASAGAASSLRNALKEHGKLADPKLESQAHAALSAAGELEGWQRWRADQLRQELVAKAEALFERSGPATAPQAQGLAPGPASTQEIAAASTQETAVSGAQEAVASGASEPAVSELHDGVADSVQQDATGSVQQPAAAISQESVVPALSEQVEPVPPGESAQPISRPASRPPRKVPSVDRKPRYGGRKMQEQLRALREQWKQTDQGGPPNHALWKRFDEACNEAHKVVESWLEKIKAEAAEHRAHRLALIEEIKAWSAENTTAKDGDWKGFNRILHQFGDRWRDAGHLGEKAFAELQPLWKDAIHAAAAPLEALQKQSLERRHAMIDEARELGAQPQLRIDAVKSLQQRWQAEAQGVPLDRKHEQKLWDAFRKPIDEAFNRKSEERDQAAAQLSERDRIVLDASKALEAANASGDAQKIRTAMASLEAALRGQAQAAEAVARADQAAKNPGQASGPATDVAAMNDATDDASAQPAAAGEPDAAADTAGSASSETGSGDSDAAPAETVAAAASAPTAAPKPAAKPVVAMRGDDRPGMKKSEPMAPGRGGKFGDRKGAAPGGRFGERRDERGPRPEGRYGDRPAFEDRGPRLGDVAFRAQREALEHAQSALKKLAAQAHGEALTQLMTAWEQRSGEQVPSLNDLGKSVSAPVRTGWVQAVSKAPSGDASEALMRLEIAAEAPTPAEHLSARRLLQLQLLTRRNDPAPDQTWGQDTAKVLATGYDAAVARRLQTVLKALFRR